MALSAATVRRKYRLRISTAVSIRSDRRGVARPRLAARTGARPRVLVTEGDNVGVIAMVRGLARAGYEPWVAATHRTAPVLRSRATAGVAIVPDPSTSGSAFVRAVEDLASEIEPVAILPGGEKGMLALADLAKSQLMRSRLAICDRQSVYRATDKAKLAEIAAEVGLNVPETFLLNAEEAARKPLPIALPAVVKPPRTEVPSNGGFRTYAVRPAATRDQVIAALRSLPGERGLLQQHHRGTLCAIGGIFWSGEVVAAVYQRAIRTWPMGCGQMSFAIALPRDLELERRVASLLAGLDWSGLFQMQFIETEEGRLLIDLNPRVYGSLSLALGVGQNLPAIWVDLLQGETMTPTEYRPGVSFRNELLDAFSLFASARRTRWMDLARAAAAHANTHAFFEPGDPMPLLALGPTVAVKLGSRAKLHASIQR